MNEAGLICICAFVAPSEAARRKARAVIGDDRFIEVHLSAPAEVCRVRDTEGMYARADSGEIQDFPGRHGGLRGPGGAGTRPADARVDYRTLRGRGGRAAEQPWRPAWCDLERVRRNQLPTANSQLPRDTLLNDFARRAWRLGVGSWELGIGAWELVELFQQPAGVGGGGGQIELQRALERLASPVGQARLGQRDPVVVPARSRSSAASRRPAPAAGRDRRPSHKSHPPLSHLSCASRPSCTQPSRHISLSLAACHSRPFRSARQVTACTEADRELPCVCNFVEETNTTTRWSIAAAAVLAFLGFPVPAGAVELAETVNISGSVFRTSDGIMSATVDSGGRERELGAAIGRRRRDVLHDGHGGAGDLQRRQIYCSVGGQSSRISSAVPGGAGTRRRAGTESPARPEDGVCRGPCAPPPVYWKILTGSARDD